MQLSVIEPKQMLVPMLKTKQLDLADEILSKISFLPESEQAELLALAAPKLQGEKLKQGFDMLLRLEGSLSKGLALIDFLPYLIELNVKIVLGEEILKCINNVDKKEKIELIEKLIEQLESQKKATVGWSAYLTNLSQDLALIVKNSSEFKLKEQISLEGKSFKLMYWNDAYKHYSLYPQEKKRLLEEIKSNENPTEKYLALLALLKEFPLAEEEIGQLSCLALSALNRDDVRELISIKDKLALLEYLPKEDNKIFSLQIYKEVLKADQSLVNYLENLNTFSIYSCCKEFDADVEDYSLTDDAVIEMAGLLEGLCDSEERMDEEYFGIIKFLSEMEFFNTYWSYEAVRLVENISSPITKVDAVLLLVGKLDKPNLLLKKMLIEQALETLPFIEDGKERISLATPMLQYVSGKSKETIAFTLIEQIALFPKDVEKANLLVDLVPYLTPKLRKKAFEIGLSIGNYFDTIWACISFAPYLTQKMREGVIQDGFNVLNKPAYSITFSQKALILKQLIKFGLGSANKG